MLLFISLAIIFLSLILSAGKSKKGFLGTITVILFFPIAVIFALANKYK